MSYTDNDTVYVVDDDSAVRDSLKLLLESHNLRVRQFDTAPAFLDGYEHGTAMCLILDLHLPIISGLALMKMMKDRGIDLPVVVLTGNGDDDVMSRALQEGAIAFLEKPVYEHALMEAISKARLMTAGSLMGGIFE
jgi:two-component system response regulator FixJ